MSDELIITQVSSWQRSIVVVLYIVATVAALWGLAHVVTSTNCQADGGCTKIDQVIYAVVGVFDFILAFIWVVLGMKGLLPGARRTVTRAD